MYHRWTGLIFINSLQINTCIIMTTSSINCHLQALVVIITLVTQPMLQLRPNCTELRSMDYYHQIFCRFRKCKWKVPPPSPLSNDFEKSWFFSKNLVTFLFSKTKNFRPYNDFWSKISCIGTWKLKAESFEKIFNNKIFKSWFYHVRVWVEISLLLLLTFFNPRWYFWNKND